MTKRRQHIGALRRLAAGVVLGLPSLFVASLGACAVSPPDPGEPAQADVFAIEATLRAQCDAWNRGDLHAFVAGYAESPERMTFVGSKGVLVRGRAALEERYRKSYPEGRQGTLKFGDLEVRRIGADAYLVLGTWALALPPEDPHGRFTLLFERGPEGLQIVHDHSSGAE